MIKMKAALIAPTIAALTKVQLQNLIDQNQFFPFLTKATSSEEEQDRNAPDSPEAGESAAAAADSEEKATGLLAKLHPGDLDYLRTVARKNLDPDLAEELLALLPL
ncbi:MAG: hypothetical protein O3A92_16380 [Verrucomicrobia bacterium]|nr:hypothetical protein [Verrucomicrobiota bacterium]